MGIKVKDVVRWMEEWAPPQIAEPGDPIGLQVGAMDAPVTRIAVALDVTEAVVDEAVEQGAQLIIAHHPLIFRPLKTLRTDRPEGRILSKLLQHGISVFAAHTNLDTAAGGVNDLLAEALGLQDCVPLRTAGAEELYKLVVYTPHSHAESVSQAVFAAGAGHLGNYSHCGFKLSGTGTFLPEDGAKPFLGQVGQVERAEEERFETVVPASRKDAVIAAMKQAHPYEEVAYDLYRLEIPGTAYGLGRVGNLPAEMPLKAFVMRVKEAFGLRALRYVGDGNAPVRRAAVLGGSGRSFMKDALASGADVFVTGDLDHHTALDAKAAGLLLVDAGHHIEQIMKEAVADRLRRWLEQSGASADVYASKLSTDPFTFA